MKRTKKLRYISAGTAFIVLLLTGSCTKLNEKVYDKVAVDQFLTRRDDVIRDFLRPFEHAYWSIQGNDIFAVNEDSSDELATVNRQGDWQDGGYYQRMHYHTWTINDGFTNGAWTAFYQGITLATNSLQDPEHDQPAEIRRKPAQGGADRE